MFLALKQQSIYIHLLEINVIKKHFWYFSKANPLLTAWAVFNCWFPLWLGRILLFNSSFILEISDNWHHSSFSLTPLQNWSVWSRKKWAVHSGLCVYTFVQALLLCHNETANAEKMLNAQMTWNPPDSSVLVKQELFLWGHSVQQAGVRVLSNRQINKTEDHRLYLKWMCHDSAGLVLYDFSNTMFCFY